MNGRAGRDNALLFQAGQPDPRAEDIPDWTVAEQRITDMLAVSCGSGTGAAMRRQLRSDAVIVLYSRVLTCSNVFKQRAC